MTDVPIEYSVIFKSPTGPYINTWDDWHIVPTTRPAVSPPAVKANYVEVPGANGSIDFTDALRGFPVYQNRTGSIEFVVLHEYWPSWIDTYHTIMGYLHGRRIKMYLGSDPNYYYEGRFSVNNWKTNKDYSRITIDYNVDPFKMEDSVTTKTSTGASIVIAGSQVGDMPICPGISTGKSGIEYKFENQNISRLVDWTAVPFGEEKTNPKVVMTSGNSNNTFTFRNTGSGSYTITITYRRGYL